MKRSETGLHFYNLHGLSFFLRMGWFDAHCKDELFTQDCTYLNYRSASSTLIKALHDIG